MTHEEKMAMREKIYAHLSVLLEKIHKMFQSSNELTVQQMLDASDILKDLSKADSALSKSCYYDSIHADSDGKKY